MSKKEITITLPTQKIKAVYKSPKNLIIFSAPKVGKTELLSQLEGCLLLDLEDGSDYVNALKIKASTVGEIKKIGEQIKAENYPYAYIAVDTITALENICIPYAEILYAKTPMGKNWFKKDKTNPAKLAPESGKAQYGIITSLPNGAGL